MKIISTYLFTIFIATGTFAQTITGSWNGLLKVQGIQLRVVFNISEASGAYTATMDSPDQGVNGIPVTTITFENNNLRIEIPKGQIVYEGKLQGETVFGTFTQAGQSFPMDLSQKIIERKFEAKPQDPKEPFPYFSEEIFFPNKKAKAVLAGTLTLPQKEGIFPAVILISGSGPQDRNEELLGHRPFLVLSDYLTRNGIAVLRFDDRGTGKSTGDFSKATSADFATDVLAAIAYLKTRKEINADKIGLMGHSEGGIIAPMVAAKSKDVDFIVLLAGTGIRGDKLLALQQELISRASGTSEEDIQQTLAVNKGAFELIVNSGSTKKLRSELTDYFKVNLSKYPEDGIPKGMSEDEFIEVTVNQLLSPWFVYFIKLDPAVALQKVNCPVLAVNGEKDLQVPPGENLSAISAALEKAGNKRFTKIEFENLNHLFQECETGSPSEYSQIEQTFSPRAMEEITNWVKEQVK